MRVMVLNDRKNSQACEAASDNGVYIKSPPQEVQTKLDLAFPDKKEDSKNCSFRADYGNCFTRLALDHVDALHFLTLIIIAVVTWGILYTTIGEQFAFNAPWFRLIVTPMLGLMVGHLLQCTTTLPPLLGPLLLGILLRNLNYLDIKDFPDLDAFLRKIYPVIILGKSSLGWDFEFIRNRWTTVLTLGVMPWAAEVVAVALTTHFFLGFPWIWGYMLGSFYASLSGAVVLPSIQGLHNSGFGGLHQFPKLVATAGGLDTTLSVGVFGLLYSFIFSEAEQVYRITKACFTLLVGAALGVAWGSLAKFTPHRDDFYVTELRVLIVLLGGLLANFGTSYVGWAGAGGVAVLLCNATAATHWAPLGWKLNNNPASTAYRVMWSFLEPILFTYTGTHFLISNNIKDTMVTGVMILAICLSVRLLTAFLVTWGAGLTLKERLYICCTWIPKSIVEAVLCPLAYDAVMRSSRSDEAELKHAEHMIQLIVQAILLTTPVGYLLTRLLGPKLLTNKLTQPE